MGRKAHVDFRARRSLPQFLSQLKSKQASDWSQPLFAAWKILNNELALEPAKALSVILESVSAAHRCVRAQNQQLNDLEEARTHTTIRKACNRISKCINRAPALVRGHLDQAIHPLIQESVIDLEVIESIFEASRAIFDEFADIKSSRTALTAFCELRAAPFSTLGMALRREAESAIAGLAAASSATGREATASDVFATVAAVLEGDTRAGLNTLSGKLISRYVAELAEIWRRAGLKPSRAIGFLNTEYRAKFHRFSELVLRAMADNSRAERHGGDPSSRELVSDHHLRKALKTD